MTETTGRVIFTATHDWYQLVIRDGELTVSDEAFCGDWLAAAELAEINTDYDDAWVCVVEAVGDRHTAIKVGDYACCDGYGCDVVFVRL